MFPIIDKQRTGQRIRMLMKQQNITVKQIKVLIACLQIIMWYDFILKRDFILRSIQSFR